MKYKLALVMSVLCAFSAWTEAKFKLPAILSDGMVLQRERPVKIWGNADKGENVTVVFKKKKFSTVAGEDGIPISPATARHLFLKFISE